MIENIQLVECSESNYIKPKRMVYLQNGIQKKWDLVQVHDSVAILLYHEENDSFIVVRQFRPPVFLHNNDGYTYELCAGIVDKNKTLEEIAQEEIFEECGFSVSLASIKKITSFYTSVGFAGSQQHLYFAIVNDSMRTNKGGGIGDEVIDVLEISIHEAKEFILDESKAKTPGLMFAFEWFLYKNNR